MNAYIEILLILFILFDLTLLGMSRLRACIAVSSLQGMLLGVFTVLGNTQGITLRIGLIAAAAFLLKGFVFPHLLRRSIREANAGLELEPYVGYSLSVIAGLVMLGASLWLGAKLPIVSAIDISLVVPTALMTFFTGLFLIIARKNALTQCLGYIIVENGIYIIGVAAVVEIPLLVELGILLDASVAVLVMGVAIYHINREFDHIETDRLDTLKG